MSIMLYGLMPSKEDTLPQFPFPIEEGKLKMPFKKENKMDKVQEFIKKLRKKVSETSGYINKERFDTIILDVLEEMNNNE